MPALAMLEPCVRHNALSNQAVHLKEQEPMQRLLDLGLLCIGTILTVDVLPGDFE